MTLFLKKYHFLILLFFFTALTFTASTAKAEKREKDNSKNFLFVSLVSSSTEAYEPVFLGNADSVIIPLKKVGRLFLIDAKVDEQTGNLVFDTGANGLVLNNTYFRDYARTGGAVSSGITGTVGKVEKISVEKIEFANLTYQKLRADVTSLGHIENRRGVKILGLVGFSMMKNLGIVLDAPNSELRLYKLDKEGNRLSKNSPEEKVDYSQKINEKGNILFLKGKIAGKTLNFCFDTGAETNAISSDAGKAVLSTLTITRRMKLRGAGTAKSEVLFGTMNNFIFGEKKIANMETIVTNLYSLSEVYNTSVDGMLGFNFLEQGVISINFVNKQFGIRFTKGNEK